jgi:hypothetical protein
MIQETPRPAARGEAHRAAGLEALGGAFDPHNHKAISGRQGIEQLDAALLRLFPSIPDDARKFLRKPLARLHKVAPKFLTSKQDWGAELRFAATVYEIVASEGRARRLSDVAALLLRLDHREFQKHEATT